MHPFLVLSPASRLTLSAQQETEINSIHQLVVGATENVKEGNEDIREVMTPNAGSEEPVASSGAFKHCRFMFTPFTFHMSLQAIKNNAGFRVWILFFLVMCSFSLLFLDWYDS